MLLDALSIPALPGRPTEAGLQAVVVALQQHYHCHAAAVLRLHDGYLHPVAATGLATDVLGRRFRVDDHPRLAAILSQHDTVRFPPGTRLPDPYDGLIDDGQAGRHAIPVHDCMGISLRVDGRLCGAVTLDALPPRVFDEWHCRTLQAHAPGVARIIDMPAAPAAAMPAWSQPAPLPGLPGRSDVMRQLQREVAVIARTDVNVLLTGETGVGKEWVAQALHHGSPRARRPLITVNCAALPVELAESELFGYVRGAFSGAAGERSGRFEAAHGGTLLLDEVGELPLAIQAKLLRVLQNGEVQRLGSDRIHRVDVRVVAATHRNLTSLVADGHFRADLYHRLAAYPLSVPPLRARGHDILALAGHFMEYYRSRLGLRSLRLSDDGRDALLCHRWPGNVRELEHAIHRATLRAMLDLDGQDPALSEIILNAPLLALSHGEPAGMGAPAAPGAGLRQQVEALQRQRIVEALQRNGQRWGRAAQQLDMDASNLRKLAARLGIEARPASGSDT